MNSTSPVESVVIIPDRHYVIINWKKISMTAKQTGQMSCFPGVKYYGQSCDIKFVFVVGKIRDKTFGHVFTK